MCKSTRFACLVGCLFCLVLLASTARGQDRVFTYTYQSTVLGRGQRELEVWNTFRFGKKDYFRAFDNRIEFEIGLTRDLQTAFYLNIRNWSGETTLSQLLPDGMGGFRNDQISSLAGETELSFSNEWKLKLLDPIANPVGLALYGEYSLSSTEIELEPRLILDKAFGQILTAFNAAGEFEFETEIEESGGEHVELEKSLELDLAVSVNLHGGIFLGAEIVNRNGFEDGTLAFSALFAGPVLSYATEGFWVNLTILPQVTALKGATREGLDLDHFERLETRLMFSYVL